MATNTADINTTDTDTDVLITALREMAESVEYALYSVAASIDAASAAARGLEEDDDED